MTFEYLANAGPELVEDVPSYVATDGGPEIAESSRDELRPIRTINGGSDSC